jgi:hypothetical protein
VTCSAWKHLHLPSPRTCTRQHTHRAMVWRIHTGRSPSHSSMTSTSSRSRTSSSPLMMPWLMASQHHMDSRVMQQCMPLQMVLGLCMQAMHMGCLQLSMACQGSKVSQGRLGTRCSNNPGACLHKASSSRHTTCRCLHTWHPPHYCSPPAQGVSAALQCQAIPLGTSQVLLQTLATSAAMAA